MRIESKASGTVLQADPNPEKANTNREKVIQLLMGNKPQSEAAQTPPAVMQAQADTNIQGHADKVEAQATTETSTSTTEDAAADPAAKKEKEAPLSSQYAVLARKEKQLRVKAQQQELAYKQREEALRAREAELTRKDTEYKTQYVPKERLTQDTINVLLEQGLTHDQIAQQLLNQPTIDPAILNLIKDMKAEIAELKNGVQETKKSYTDKQAEDYQTAINQIRTDASTLIKADPAYETILETGSVEDVVKLIVETHEKDGIVLSLEEAAQTVEESLVEEAMKIARIKKIQQRLNAAPAQTPKPGTDAKKPNELKTLTNSVGTVRQLTARERAIAVFEGKKIST